MKKTFILFTISFYFQFLFSQISNIIPTTSSIAETSVSDTHNWTAFNNPSMLGYLTNSEFQIQFSNRFIIPELSTKSIQLGLSTNLVNTGLSFSHFGYSQYHEMMIGLGFARNFADKFAMGVQFNYFTTYFAASNSYRSALLPQIGISVKISPTLNFGFNVINPFQTNIKTEFSIKRIPSIFSLGTEYFFSKELVWRLQMDKEMSSNYRFASGFEYCMLKNFTIKLGAYGSDYLIPCLGVGLNTGSFIFNLNCELHPILGLNTMAAIKYHFGK